MYFSCLDPDSGSDFKLENFLSAPSETFDPHYGMYCLASRLCSFIIYTFATLTSITQGRIQGPHPIFCIISCQLLTQIQVTCTVMLVNLL